MLIESITDSAQIIVSGHRGYKAAYPENTLLSFQQAVAAGVHMLELDLRMSKDKQVVIIHDETVDRTTNGSGKVGEMAWEQLQALDAGGWMGPSFAGLKIPSFEQFCQLMLAYPHLLLNIEVKPSSDAEEVVDAAIAMLKQFSLYERCVFTCFDAAIIAYLHDRYAAKTQGFRGDKMTNFVEGEQGTYSKMWAIALEMSHLNRNDVKLFKHMGKQVWSYCPDTAQDVLYSVGAGATVMTCNNPMPALQLKKLLEQA